MACFIPQNIAMQKKKKSKILDRALFISDRQKRQDVTPIRSNFCQTYNQIYAAHSYTCFLTRVSCRLLKIQTYDYPASRTTI